MSQSKSSAPDFDIFLSYSRKDVDTMHRVKRDFEAQGFRVWIDETGLPPGTSNWEIAIEGAIENVKCLTVLYSPDSKKSRWVRSELRYAEHHKKPIFGLLVRGNDSNAIPLGSINSQYVDIRTANDYEPNLRHLMQTLGSRIGIEPCFVTEAREAEQLAREAAAEAKRREEAARLEQEAENKRRQEAAERERLEKIAADKAAREQAAREKRERDEAAKRERREQAAARREAKQAARQNRKTTSTGDVNLQRIVAGGGVLTGLVAIVLVLLFSGVLDGSDDESTPTSEAAVADTPMDEQTEVAQDDPTSTPTPSPLEQLAQIPVENNDDWEPYIQEFDGIPMALVPVGCFEMGSEDGNSDEEPVETICIEEPFWIDVYEVTNEQYGSVGCSSSSSAPDQPRNCVDWFEATAHCEDRGGRLPTEAEWEYAARGPNSLVYPWGNEWNPDNAVWSGNSGDGTNYVGSRPQGQSWVGAMDMSGNVWEWVSSLYMDYPYGSDHEDIEDDNSTRVLRGGSFFDTAYFLRSSFRSYWGPVDAFNGLGFRCARSYQ